MDIKFTPHSTHQGNKQTVGGLAQYNSAELASMIANASIDQTFALDTELHVVSWNTACELATNIKRDEALGRHLTEVRQGVEESGAIAEAIERALRGFKSFVPWEAACYGSGYHEHHIIPLIDRDAEVCGILVIIHDVAHRIRAEEELKLLNKALTLKNKLLKQRTDEVAQFNWAASHDLKEPLRKIYTFIEMAATREGKKLSDATRNNLRRAQSAVQRMGLLTDDIVNFAEAAAPDEALADVQLERILSASKERHQNLITDTCATVESAALPTIVGYPKMLQHLFNHMLSNALRFHEEGAQPLVRIGYGHEAGSSILSADADKDVSYHCLSFSDNGIGFALEYKEKIFAMFQRLNPEGRYKGAGMGLPIANKIMEAHEGFITVESTVGVGTTFSCYLKDLDKAATI